MTKIDKNAQDRFFAELGDALTEPATVYVFGGTSLICLEMPGRLTDDVDAYSAEVPKVKAALQTLVDKHQWQLDDMDVAAISEVPTSLAKQPTLYRRFGLLSVMIVDPNLTALGKLDRAGADDANDLRWLVSQNLLDLDVLETLIKQAKGMDDKAKSIQLFNKLTGRNMPIPPALTPLVLQPQIR